MRLLKLHGVGLSINFKISVCGGNAAFSVFPVTCAAEKHLVSEKPLIQRFFKDTGVVLAEHNDRLPPVADKGGRYGAAVKENSRSKRTFSLGTARVGSAVRKSVIFERTAFPSKCVSIFDAHIFISCKFSGGIV